MADGTQIIRSCVEELVRRPALQDSVRVNDAENAKLAYEQTGIRCRKAGAPRLPFSTIDSGSALFDRRELPQRANESFRPAKALNGRKPYDQAHIDALLDRLQQEFVLRMP